MELTGRFSDNWRGRNSRVGQVIEDIVGAISFMEDVQRAQVQLNALGYAAGTPDGKLGPVTTAALKKFQLYEKLSQTGLLDDSTKARLDERTVGMVLKLPNGTVLKPSTLVQSPGNPVPDLTDIANAWKGGTPPFEVPGVVNAPPSTVLTPPPPQVFTPPSPGGGTATPSSSPGTPGVSTTPDAETKIFGLSRTTFAVGAATATVLAGVGIALAMRRKDRAPDTEPHPGPMPPPSYARNTLVTGGSR